LAVENGIKFMETSAKASINVEEAFMTLARDIKTKMDKKLVRTRDRAPGFKKIRNMDCREYCIEGIETLFLVLCG